MALNTSPQPPTQEGAIIRKLVRGGGWAFLGKMATYPLGLILTMILARLISAADVGGYFLVMSLVMIGSALVQAGLATSTCKMIARSLAVDNPRAIKQVLRIGVTALLLTGFLAVTLLTNQPAEWLLAQLENGERLYDALAWIAAMVVVFAAVGYCCEILRGFHELPSAAILDQQLLQRLLLLAALLVPLALGLQLALLDVLRVTAVSAFLSALLGIFLISRIVARLGDHGEKIATMQVLREAPTFLLMRVNNWLLNSAAVWVIGFSRSLEETALYGAANVVALLVLAPWQVVSAATSPTIIALHASDKAAALESVMRTAAAVAALPGLLLGIVLLMYGDDVLSILFTSEYAAGYSVLVVLALGRGISTLFGSPVMLLSMTNHQNIVLRVLLVASVLTLAGYIYAADIYGAIGVAYVGAASAILQGMFLAIAARRVLGINTLPHVSIRDLKQFLTHLK